MDQTMGARMCVCVCMYNQQHETHAQVERNLCEMFRKYSMSFVQKFLNMLDLCVIPNPTTMASSTNQRSHTHTHTHKSGSTAVENIVTLAYSSSKSKLFLRHNTVISIEIWRYQHPFSSFLSVHLSILSIHLFRPTHFTWR